MPFVYSFIQVLVTGTEVLGYTQMPDPATIERRKSVIQEVMRSLDVRPRQLSRVTGMNYETIRSIAKKLP
jgi:hypothetical protein